MMNMYKQISDIWERMINLINHNCLFQAILGCIFCCFLIWQSFQSYMLQEKDLESLRFKISEIGHTREGRHSWIWTIKSVNFQQTFLLPFAENNNHYNLYIDGKKIKIGDSVEIGIIKNALISNSDNKIGALTFTIFNLTDDYLEQRSLIDIDYINRNTMFSSFIERVMGCAGIFIILVIVWRFWNVPDVFKK